MFRNTIRALLLSVFAAVPALAQDPTGTIEGLITDNTAAAVADARVTVKNLDTGVTRTVTPGGDGFYRLMALPAGKYSLTVEAPKFARFAQQTRPAHVPRTWARLRSYPAQKNKRLRAQSDREDRIIRQRLGISFENALVVGMRYCAAKAWRVAWKVALGAYW